MLYRVGFRSWDSGIFVSLFCLLFRFVVREGGGDFSFVFFFRMIRSFILSVFFVSRRVLRFSFWVSFFIRVFICVTVGTLWISWWFL